MSFKPKSEKPFPPVTPGEQKAWAKKYFDWIQEPDQHHATELKKLVAEHGKGHPDYIVEMPETKAIVSKSNDTITIPIGQLATLIEEAVEKKVAATKKDNSGNEDFRQVITDLVDSINPGAAPSRRALTEAQVDRDDYLDIPVTFFCYLKKYAIYSEMRYGQEVKTPYGRPISFEAVAGYITSNPRGGKQTVIISSTQVQTKKELEWMRKSPKFNVMFFEKAADAGAIDPVKASMLARALTEISGLSEYSVLQRALNAGIKADPDVEKMRRQLIQLIANQNAEAEKRVSQESASSADSSIEQTLMRGINPQQIRNVPASA